MTYPHSHHIRITYYSTSQEWGFELWFSKRVIMWSRVYPTQEEMMRDAMWLSENAGVSIYHEPFVQPFKKADDDTNRKATGL